MAAYNVGRNCSLAIFTSAGMIGVAMLKSFEARPMTAEVKQELISGVMLPLYLPGGWEGSFTIARADSSLDDFFANAEANYYAGGPLGVAQITETITNPDGSTSQFTFTGVALKLDDAGTWSGNKEVDQKVSFMASRRMGQ